MVRAIAESSGRVEILRAISLAARIGSPEIRKEVADYASAQLEWVKSPNNSEPVLENMELKVRGILQLIPAELRELDENVARHPVDVRQYVQQHESDSRRIFIGQNSAPWRPCRLFSNGR
jgi:hypothetical protein